MTTDRAADESTILKLDKAFLDAFLQRDVETVNRDLPDDFIAIFPNGIVANKQMELKNVEQAEVESYSTDEVQIGWYAETVATVHFRMTLKMKGKEPKLVRDLHVYMKRDGRWQMITGQVTPIL